MAVQFGLTMLIAYFPAFYLCTAARTPSDIGDVEESDFLRVRNN